MRGVVRSFDAVRSRDITRDVGRNRGFALVIDGRRYSRFVIRLRRSAIGAAIPLATSAIRRSTRSRILGSNVRAVPVMVAVAGMNVGGGARMECAGGDYGRLHRVDVAPDDRLGGATISNRSARCRCQMRAGVRHGRPCRAPRLEESAAARMGPWVRAK